MNRSETYRGITRLRRLSLAGVLLALVVVVLGAYTRLVDAGLGCPDWPGCYGFAIVPHTEARLSIALERFPDAPVDLHKGWAEMVHRYVAGLLLMLIATLLMVALRRARQAPMPVGLASGLFVLVVIQALFGMWTVTLNLWPQVVTAHLLGGFATLSLLWLLAQRSSPKAWLLPTEKFSQRSQLPQLQSLKRLAVITLVALIVQIALGGWTSSNYAALACTDFPTCHQQWWPDTDFKRAFNFAQTIGPNYLGGLLEGEARTAIHLSHRLGAGLVTLLIILLATKLMRFGEPAAKFFAKLLLSVLIVQVSLGISNVVFSLPLSVAVAHNAGGALLLLVMVTLLQRLYSAKVFTTQNSKEVS